MRILWFKWRMMKFLGIDGDWLTRCDKTEKHLTNRSVIFAILCNKIIHNVLISLTILRIVRKIDTIAVHTISWKSHIQTIVWCIDLWRFRIASSMEKQACQLPHTAIRILVQHSFQFVCKFVKYNWIIYFINLNDPMMVIYLIRN